MCHSKMYSYPPHGRSLEILRRWEVSKAKIFKGTRKYGAKLEFQGGRYGYFLEQRNIFFLPYIVSQNNNKWSLYLTDGWNGIFTAGEIN